MLSKYVSNVRRSFLFKNVFAFDRKWRWKKLKINTMIEIELTSLVWMDHNKSFLTFYPLMPYPEKHVYLTNGRSAASPATLWYSLINSTRILLAKPSGLDGRLLRV